MEPANPTATSMIAAAAETVFHMRLTLLATALPVKTERDMLEAHGLGCRRDGRSLFENLSFKVEAGQLWLVRGANGSGKTSLLRILAGLSPAEQGELVWQGEREPVLWVGHRVAVSAGLTARENLEFMAALEGDEPEHRLQRSKRWGLVPSPKRARDACRRDRPGALRWPGWHSAPVGFGCWMNP